MKKINLYTILILVLLTSCENFVEVPLTDNQLTVPVVFESEATATAAMGNVYAKLRETGFLSGRAGGGGSLLGLYTDELVYNGNSTNELSFIQANNLLPVNATVQQLWNNTYNQVYGCNAILEGVGQSTSLSQQAKNRLNGEALFIRGLLHYYLACTYGDIPYITSTNYIANATISKAPVLQAYTHAAQDLELAASLLSENYTGTERITPNRYAALFMLAKVYLELGQFSQALEAITPVCETGLYNWDANLEGEFLKTGPGVIWQLGPRLAGDNADQGTTYIFNQGPPVNYSVADNLLIAFETGDLRRQHWIREITNGTSTWYHPYKYKQNTNTGTSLEYSVVMRLAEAYLIRAEARIQTGDFDGAKQDIDRIRNRAGLPPTPASTQGQLLMALQHERQVELFTEYGARFIDLKRLGTINMALAPTKPGWSDTDRLWPLPEQELLANPNINPQNPGY